MDGSINVYNEIPQRNYVPIINYFCNILHGNIDVIIIVVMLYTTQL